MIWTKDMSLAPTDGSNVLLDLDESIALAYWYEPWKIWFPYDADASMIDPKNDEIFGIGSQVPIGWMPAPKSGSDTPFSGHEK